MSNVTNTPQSPYPSYGVSHPSPVPETEAAQRSENSAAFMRRLRDEKVMQLGFPETVQQFLNALKKISDNVKPDEDWEKRAAQVCTALVNAYALDWLATVSNLFNEAMAAWAAPDAPVHTSSLTLSLRSNWNPWNIYSAKEVQKHFSQIDAQKVVLQNLDDLRMPLPEALNAGLAALLQAGTTELHLVSPPAAPSEIDFWPSSQLATVTLGDAWFHGSFTDDAIGNFKVVLNDLAACKTLKHLSLENADLLRLHETLKVFIEPIREGAVLTSIGFRRGFQIGTAGQDLPTFINTVRQIKSLQKIEVSAPWLVVGDVDEWLLSPLKGHGALTELVLNGGEAAYSPKGIQFPSHIFALALECPTLKTVRIAFNSRPTVLDLEVLREQGSDLDPQEAVTRMQESRSSSSSNQKTPSLTTFVIKNVFLPASQLDRLAQEAHPEGALALVKKVDLEGCVTDLQAMVNLTQALWKMPRVKELTLPKHHELFVTGPDKQIHGCERIAAKASEAGAPVQPGSGEYVFALRTQQRGDRVRQKPFEPRFALIAPKANAMLSAPQQQLDHGRVMVQELGRQVAYLLAAQHAEERGIPLVVHTSLLNTLGALLAEQFDATEILNAQKQVADVFERNQHLVKNPPFASPDADATTTTTTSTTTTTTTTGTTPSEPAPSSSQPASKTE